MSKCSGVACGSIFRGEVRSTEDVIASTLSAQEDGIAERWGVGVFE